MSISSSSASHDHHADSYSLSEGALQSVGEGVFFVVGNSRGGTTLLQAMLNSHSRLTITPETHFFYRLDELRERFGRVVAETRVDELVSEQCRRGGAFADLALDPAVVAETFRGTERRPEDLFLTCLALYGQARDKPRCGEKTPRHIERVEQIARLFPSARFIAIFRDPRAVVASELRARFGNPSAFVIAQRWVRYVEAHQRLVEAMPRWSYRMIRYEDLLSHPEAVLRDLCELLGERYEPQMLAFHQRPRSERGFDGREEWKEKTLQPVDRSRIEAWRSALSREQIALVERVAGRRMMELGYQPLSGAWSLPTRTMVGTLAADVFASVQATARKKVLGTGSQIARRWSKLSGGQR